MFVTARKVSCLAQDYVCVLCENNEVNEDISDEYAESEDSTDDDFDESDAEY